MWQRLVVVLPVAWVAVANAIVLFVNLHRHEEQRDHLFEVCREEQGFVSGWVKTCSAYVAVT
jgi:hypothetical protein